MNINDLHVLIDKWNIKKKPEYREFKCGLCGEKIKRAWHIWFEDEKYKTPVHLCIKCIKKYNEDSN